MIKKPLYISIIAVILIGYVIYRYRKSNGSNTVKREETSSLPENLKNIFNALQGLKYDVTTNKQGDNPSITFKHKANDGITYAVVIKKQGEVLIYDNISGTPYRLVIQENEIKKPQGGIVYNGTDIAKGILETLNNKTYI